MDLALSSRIKAIFTKVFCTFFTPFSPPSIRGHLPAYRGVAAIDEVPRTDPYETAIDSDIFIKWQRGWTSLCRTCPESNHSSSARLLHPGSIFQLAATNGSATPWKTDTICLFLPSFSSFSLQFWSLFQEFRPIVDPLLFPFSLILFFGSLKDSVRSISLNYSLSPIFPYLFPFLRYSNHSFPNLSRSSSQFFFHFSLSISNFSSPKIPI